MHNEQSPSRAHDALVGSTELRWIVVVAATGFEGTDRSVLPGKLVYDLLV